MHIDNIGPINSGQLPLVIKMLLGSGVKPESKSPSAKDVDDSVALNPGNSGGAIYLSGWFSSKADPLKNEEMKLFPFSFHESELLKKIEDQIENKNFMEDNVVKELIYLIPQDNSKEILELIGKKTDISNHIHYFYENEINIVNKNIERERIVQNAESEALREAYALVKGLVKGNRAHEEAILNCFILLSKRNSPLTDNLLRLFSGGVKAGRIPKEGLCCSLLEITTQVLVNQYIRATSDKERESAKNSFEAIAMADNPPYSLTRQADKARQVFQEVVRVHARAKAIRHAFSVLMFDSMRTPQKEPPLLLRYGKDTSTSGAYWINAKDIHSFPGRGFVINGLDLEKILVLDKTKEDPLKIYSEAWEIPKENFEKAGDTTYAFIRGGIVVSSPNDKSCEITIDRNGRKEHYSYVVFNDHFGGKDFKHNGSESFYLVPTRLIQKRLEGTLIPYGDFTGFDTTKKDINDQGFNIYDIQKEAESLGLPILHLGSGSTFSGSFTNAWKPGTKWFFPDELTLAQMGGVMRDAWGHTHKGDIRGIWDQTWNEEWDRKMVDFRTAHEEVNRVVNSLQNRLDIFLLGYADYFKGNTVSEVIDDVDADEYLSSNDGKGHETGNDDFGRQELPIEDSESWRGDVHLEEEDDFWRGDIHKKEDEPLQEPVNGELNLFDLKHAMQHLEFANDPKETFKNPNSMRALVEAYKWHNGLKEQGKEDKDLYPVLALGPSTNLWEIKESPFYLDTFDMTLRVGDKIYRFPEHKTGKRDFEAEELWYELVVPHLASDNAIRLYHRKDLMSVMTG